MQFQSSASSGMGLSQASLTQTNALRLANDAYHSVNHLQQIKATAGSDPNAALSAISEQFESLLIHQMLKSMRSANNVWAKDGLFNSARVAFYQQMLDDQMSVELTNAGGIDFARNIERDLSQHTVDRSSNEKLDLQSRGAERAWQSIRRSNASASREMIPLVKQSIQQHGTENEPVHSVVFASRDDFVNAIREPARRAAEQLGVEAEAVVAQAALETGWGKYVIKNSDGSSSYNLFGIKADSRWSGNTATTRTLEYIEGKPIKVAAAFRSYESIAHAFDDYVAFISQSDRYSESISSPDYPAALQQAGYATDPAYADKIYNIMQRVELSSGADS